MARLIVKHQGQVRREIEIKEEILIGRDVNADVLIGPPASRKHAKIEHDGGAFILTDLNSKIGTFVDGHKIRKVPLVNGMQISIGDYMLIFCDPVRRPADESGVGWVAEGDLGPRLDVVARVDAGADVFSQQIDAIQTPAEARRLRQHLQIIHDIGMRITTKRDDVELLLAEVVGTLSGVLPGAQRGFIALCDTPGGELSVRTLKMKKGESVLEMFSRTIARQAMEGRQSILCRDAREEFKSAASVQEMELGSVMCVPLLLPERAIGILQWDSRGTKGAFTRDDLNLLTGIASLLAMAMENVQLGDELRAAKGRGTEETPPATERAEDPLARAIGDSKGMMAVRSLAQQMMPVKTNVLICGETGTGKELLARAIHSGSPRADKPFIAVNCAAIPEGLLESELFGIERGTATGVEAHIGKMEQANGGTLLLDEVADMSLGMQAKLLRSIEERVIERVGGKKTIKIDTRIIAATNRDLRAALLREEFREDLYYRLHVMEIRMPPLRERTTDILTLARHFLASFVADMGKSLPGLARAAEEKLLAYAWPGNVRELRNVIERAAALADDGEWIDVDLLPSEITGEEAALVKRHKRLGSLDSAIGALEREMIALALKEADGNRTRTAELLGISREGLRLKLIRHGISDSNPS